MRTITLALLVVLTFAFASFDASAARRFGGGGNIGKQRSVPTQTQKQATPPTQQAAPSPATPAPATAPAAPPLQPKPSFMSRWGGLLAGLGIGALLGSLFGAQAGPWVGMLLAGMLVIGVLLLAMRFFGAKREPALATSGMAPAPATSRTGFSGIGSALAGGAPSNDAGTIAPTTAPALAPAEVEPFLRVAKTSFIRLQAANDAGDLDDIRDYTTPEVYAEIAMQLRERGAAPQKTEVVSLDAHLVESVVEKDYALASVRFSGLIREEPAAHPEPFDEIWHVRKSLTERNAPWMICGIQQAA